MTNHKSREPMLDMFIFETLQLIEQLEQIILESEKSDSFGMSSINEIFRVMHTIKGSAAMMLFENIATLAHAVEDLFYFLREEKPKHIEHTKITDIVLGVIDFIKFEMVKIEDGDESNGDASISTKEIKEYLSFLKTQQPTPLSKKEVSQRETEGVEQKYYIRQNKAEYHSQNKHYEVLIYFEEGCEMENIRAFTVIHNLKDVAKEVTYLPEDIINNDGSVEIIRKEGFRIWFQSSQSADELHQKLSETIFLKELEFKEIENHTLSLTKEKKEINLEDIGTISTNQSSSKEIEKEYTATKQSIISVNVTKLDKLMDLVGELVISEAMVTQNPELAGLSLDNFHKAARQLRKITSELQDVVMSIRMVPLEATFMKMNRIVRDMSKKLTKEVVLEIVGEETEVDKNIIEQIADPLMHIIRNALDHGVESSEERREKGKVEKGTITLEAKNAGGDVWIIIRDDGRGLDRDKILKKAKEHGLLSRPEEDLTDREIYSFIFLPGFSTKEAVTEFSGRGVGMDVVTKNIEKVGGAILIDSVQGQGTVVSIKIPLTLAIIDGMTIKVGKARYTIPTISIRQSFRAKENDIITDPDGNEMILIRGQCYPILRIHELYKVSTEVKKIQEGIVIMVENDGKGLCIFADELLGEQQVVVKALPSYIKKVKGIAGCTLLGDGNISLIMDIGGLFLY